MEEEWRFCMMKLMRWLKKMVNKKGTVVVQPTVAQANFLSIFISRFPIMKMALYYGEQIGGLMKKHSSPFMIYITNVDKAISTWNYGKIFCSCESDPTKNKRVSIDQEIGDQNIL